MTDTAAADTTSEDTAPTQGEPADLGDAGKKALNSERAARRAAEKERNDLKAQLDTIRSASMSDLEKLTKMAQDADARAAKAEAEAMRFRISTEYRLTGEDAEALQHLVTEDGMRSVAARLAAAAKRQQGNRSPAEGRTPATAADPMREAARQLFKRT